jgi:hypothetical protein
MQSVALISVVRHDIEQTRLQELRLLRGSVKGRDHDGLAAAALAEHCDVLLKRSSLNLHVSNLLRGRPMPDRGRANAGGSRAR